jgi:hypothetical protein
LETDLLAEDAVAANLSGPTFPANREFKREILRNSALVATPHG